MENAARRRPSPARIAYRLPSASLSIVQSDSAVNITDAKGRTRTFHTTGKRDVQTLDAGVAGTTARWIGPQFVVEFEVDQERLLRYTYERGSDRSQLLVRAQLLTHNRGPVITRVYQQSSPDAH